MQQARTTERLPAVFGDAATRWLPAEVMFDVLQLALAVFDADAALIVAIDGDAATPHAGVGLSRKQAATVAPLVARVAAGTGAERAGDPVGQDRAPAPLPLPADIPGARLVGASTDACGGAEAALAVLLRESAAWDRERQRQLEALARCLRRADTGSAETSAATCNRPFTDLLTLSHDAVIGFDLDGRITAWNPTAEKMYGYSQQEALGMALASLVPGGREQEERDCLAAIRAGRDVAVHETVRRARDGGELAVLVSAFPVHCSCGQAIGGFKIVRDVTRLRWKEREAERLMQFYSALSRVNGMLVHQPGRDALLEGVCRSLVTDAGLTLAWIGFLDQESRMIVPAAVGGTPSDYVDRLVVHADDDRPEGRGPAGLAFRSGQFEVRNDLDLEPAMDPWRDRLQRGNLRSSAAIPIRQGGRVCGVLNVYSDRRGFFGEKEIGLLQEVAESIGFGLDDGERQQAKARAEAAIAAERRLTDAIFDGMPGMLVVYDSDARFLRWNRNFERLTGYSGSELKSMTRLDLVPESEREDFQQRLGKLLERGKDAYDAHIRAKDGSELPFFLSGQRVDLESGAGVIGVGLDLSARVAAENARRTVEQRYQRLFSSAPAGFALLSPDGRCNAVNPRFCQMLGRESETLVGTAFIDWFTPQQAESIRQLLQKAKAGEPASGEWVLARAGMDRVELRLIGSAIGDGELMVVARDITLYKTQARRIERLDRLRRMVGGIHSVMLRRTDRALLLLEACRVAAHDGGFVLAVAMDFDAVSQAPRVLAAEGAVEGLDRLLDLLRQPRTDAETLSWNLLRTGHPVIVNSMHTAGVSDDVRSALGEVGVRSGAVFPLRTGDVTTCVLVLLASEPAAFDEEEIELLTWMVNDLSYALEHIHTAHRLERLTYFDPMTGLMNARAFHKRLAELAAVAGARRARISVCVLDLEGFAQVNRQLGYELGDHLLRAVGDRVRAVVGDDGLVGRSGGDKFAAARLAATADALDAFEHQLLAIFDRPFEIAGHSVVLSAGLGVARYPEQEGSYEIPVSLEQAEMAVRAAKEQGERKLLFSAADEAMRSAGRSLEIQLREALERGEFTLVYQPKVDVVKGKMSGGEALLRWRHPERGLLGPAEFIDVAERSGLIVPIGTWVIQQVCAQQAEWRARGFPIQPVAANVSAAQLSRGDLFGGVAKALADNALEPKWLELEITESAVMQDIAMATATLKRLRELGVSLALDDFGTGYSSLSQLKRLPFSRIKIDRSFIDEVTTSVQDAAIAEAIIGIARSLGLTSVAEGVETAAQLNYLTRHQCDEIQGYYFSPPVDADTFAGFLRQDRKLALLRSQEDERRRILVVDDEPSICKAMGRLLREEGYNVVTADSGARALEILAEQTVHVIISDQRMPAMSGTELLDRVKGLYPGIVRIIVSGYTDIRVITDAVNRGAVFRFLTKPWDDDELLDVVREAFAISRQTTGGDGSRAA